MSLRNALLRIADRALAGLQGSSSLSCVEPNDAEFFWGMRNLPLKAATQHLGVIGTTGSGKTTLIQLFIQSIAPRFRPDAKRAEQLIIYDAQCEILPLLDALGLNHHQENFWILNPVDQRCSRWKMGEAAQEPGYPDHIAHLLVPPEYGSNSPFWADASRNLVRAVIDGLNASHGPTWSFRDLLCALDSKEHIARVSSHSPRGDRTAAAIIGDKQHSDGIISTLSTKLQKFDQVAALWHNPPSEREFSINEFFQKPGVLVLGFDPVLQDSLWPTNAIILKALAEQILRHPATNQPRQWFIFDEFASMRNVSCIVDLLNRGRSKGASVLLGNLNFPGLVNIYGREGAEQILSLLTYKCFLRTGDPTTAQWMENYINRIRFIETDYSANDKGDGTTSYRVQERSPLMASVFLDMPIPRPGGEFHLVSDLPDRGGIHVTRSVADDIFSLCTAPSPHVAALERRLDPRDMQLIPWTDDEETYFCRAEEEKPNKEAKRKTHAKKKRLEKETSSRKELSRRPPRSKSPPFLPSVTSSGKPKDLPASFRRFHGD